MWLNFCFGFIRTGLALLLMVIVQVILGSVAHLFMKPVAPSATARFPTLSNKSIIRLSHIALGITISITGFFQTRSGLDEWYTQSDAGTEVPKVVSVLMWIVVVFVSIAYIAGWVMEGMGRLNNKRYISETSSASEEEKNGDGLATPEVVKE